jgi:hypothetical protein
MLFLMLLIFPVAVFDYRRRLRNDHPSGRPAVSRDDPPGKLQDDNADADTFDVSN